ncbi:MAG: hypothetical protein WCQ57_05450 [Verrucomicrobiota bacterium]
MIPPKRLLLVLAVTLASNLHAQENLIRNGWILSAPMALERDASHTSSLWVKATGGPSRINIALPPMARETATGAGRIFSKGANTGFDVTPDWQRISVTYKPT